MQHGNYVRLCSYIHNICKYSFKKKKKDRISFIKSKYWEIWIDKETGLPIKEINKEGTTEFFPGTEVVKDVRDNVQQFKYEFGIVTDDDIKVPDFAGYEVEYSTNQEIEELLRE